MALLLTHALKNPDGFKDWFWVSRHPDLTIKMILDYPATPWIWSMVSCNKSISMGDIIDNDTLPWDWPSVSLNPNWTSAMLQRYPDKPWYFAILGMKSTITVKDIMDRRELKDFVMIKRKRDLEYSSFKSELYGFP
jgi:hypothetical protein